MTTDARGVRLVVTVAGLILPLGGPRYHQVVRVPSSHGITLAMSVPSKLRGHRARM